MPVEVMEDGKTLTEESLRFVKSVRELLNF
jgi:hypothetical protein